MNATRTLGLTLVELLVSIVIFGIVALAVTGVLPTIFRSIATATPVQT